MMNEIIGFVGEIGAGKTYLSFEKVKELKSDGKSCLVTAWADAVKDVIAKSIGLLKSGPASQDALEYLEINSFIDIKDFFCRNFVEQIEHTALKLNQTEIYEKVHEVCQIHKTSFRANLEGILKDPENYAKYYRSIIQMVGTEFGRAIDENLWIEITLAKIRNAFKYGVANVAIIDDIRFPNEFDAFENLAKKLKCKSTIYGVKASIETRSQRTGFSVKELKEYSQHRSEKFIPELIARLPEENIVLND